MNVRVVDLEQCFHYVHPRGEVVLIDRQAIFLSKRTGYAHVGKEKSITGVI